MGHFREAFGPFAVVFEGFAKIHVELVPAGLARGNPLFSGQEDHFGANQSDWETLEILESV